LQYREQGRLKGLLRLSNHITLAQLKYVGGVDLSFPLNDSDHAVACVVVLEFPSMKLIHSSYKLVTLSLPYIPGYLAFREVQPLLELLTELKATKPDIYPQVILVDGMLFKSKFNISSFDIDSILFLSYVIICTFRSWIKETVSFILGDSVWLVI
jgi:hypothetical protein